MKKILITISSSILLLSACSGHKTKDHNHDQGTHQHEDGSVHQNHEADTVKQLEFNVPVDTTIKKKNMDKEHKHDGHEHPHKH